MILKSSFIFILLFTQINKAQLRCEHLHQPPTRLKDFKELSLLMNTAPKSWYQNHLGGPVFGHWKLVFKNDQRRLRYIIENFDLNQIRTTEELNALVRGLSELSFGTPKSIDYWLKNSVQSRWQQELLTLKNKNELSQYLTQIYGPLDSSKSPGKIKKTFDIIINLFMLPIRLWPANLQEIHLSGKNITETLSSQPELAKYLKKYDNKQAYEYFRQNVWSRVVVAGLILQSLFDHFDQQIEQLQEQSIALEALSQVGPQIMAQYQDQVKEQFIDLMIKAMNIYQQEQNLFPELKDPQLREKLVNPPDMANESPALKNLRHCIICANIYHLSPREIEPGRFEERFNFCPVPPSGLCKAAS